MLRTLKISLFSALMMVAACKKADKVEDKTKAADPAQPTAPAAKPADPAAKPADPAAKPADPAAKPADPAKPVAPAVAGENTELEVKGVAMMQRMGDVFAANAKDCDKLATEIKAFIVQNKPLLEQLTAMEKALSDDQKKAFEARNRSVQEDVMKKMGPAMESCRDSKSLEAAMKEFPTD